LITVAVEAVDNVHASGRKALPAAGNAHQNIGEAGTNAHRDSGALGTRSSKRAKRQPDILKDEESQGHLSAEAVRIGRIIEAVFEWRSSGLDSRSQWHHRVDNSGSPDLSAVQLDRTAAIATYEQWLQEQVGGLGIAFLRQILFERMSYAEIAAQRGNAGERGKSYVAYRFRTYLEELGAKPARRSQRSQRRETSCCSPPPPRTCASWQS
jgi:hypothetical protein